MSLVDAEYKFVFSNVGCNGRISDGGVFQLQDYQNFWKPALHCPTSEPVGGRYKPLPHIIVADDTFPLMPSLMKPCPRSTENVEHCVKSFQL
jgi:hypothetical protein